jgi:trans-2-enoyl-CoA reductase
MTTEKIEIAAQYIVEQIILDLNDRRGLRQEWENIDEDIQEEIKEQWKYIAIAAMYDDMN